MKYPNISNLEREINKQGKKIVIDILDNYEMDDEIHTILKKFPGLLQ